MAVVDIVDNVFVVMCINDCRYYFLLLYRCCSCCFVDIVVNVAFVVVAFIVVAFVVVAFLVVAFVVVAVVSVIAVVVVNVPFSLFLLFSLL